MTPLRYLIAGLTLAVLVLLAIGLNQCGSARRAATEARINAGQAGAAAESGSDAVETVGKQSAGEDAIDAITKGNADEIRNAEGADTPVPSAVGRAALRSLCRRAAYSHREECLQFTPAE